MEHWGTNWAAFSTWNWLALGCPNHWPVPGCHLEVTTSFFYSQQASWDTVDNYSRKRVAVNNLSLKFAGFLLVESTLYRNLTTFAVFSSSTSGWEICLIKSSAPLCSRNSISICLSWTSARNPTWSCQGCGFWVPQPLLAQALGLVGPIGFHPLSRERAKKRKRHLRFFFCEI